MEVKLKVKDVVEAWPAGTALSGQKLKINPSFWLARQMRGLKVTVETFEEKRLELFRQYGNLDDKTQQWRVKPEHEKAFNTEIKGLLDQEVTEKIEPKAVSFLGLPEIEPVLLTNLWFLFTDEEPNPEPEHKHT